jgi:hypothetical protein
MRNDDARRRLFADLEASLEAEDRAQFESEVTELARAERAALHLADRLRAHVGSVLAVHLVEGDEVRGRVGEVGADWLLVAEPAGGALVPLASVVGVEGLTRASAPAPSPDGPPALRPRIGVALRAIARDRSYVWLRLRGGLRIGGTLDRVGADHVDVALHPVDEPRRASAVTAVRCVPVHALVAVRSAERR